MPGLVTVEALARREASAAHLLSTAGSTGFPASDSSTIPGASTSLFFLEDDVTLGLVCVLLLLENTCVLLSLSRLTEHVLSDDVCLVATVPVSGAPSLLPCHLLLSLCNCAGECTLSWAPAAFTSSLFSSCSLCERSKCCCKARVTSLSLFMRPILTEVIS